MAKTYEQTREGLDRRRKEDESEPGGGGGEFEERSPTTFRGESIRRQAEKFGKIAIPTPADLSPGAVGDRQQDRRNRNRSLQDSIFEQIGLSLEQISQNIQDGQSVDFSQATQNEILGFMANMLLDQSRMMQVLVTTNVSQLQASLDIADAVEPARSVVVSGTTEIDQGGSPQPLISESDKSEIPVKHLYIRASENNKSALYIGDDRVQPDDGFVLHRGEWISMEMTFKGEALYVVSSSEGDEVQVLGMI